MHNLKKLVKKIQLLFSPTCELCSKSIATQILEVGKRYPKDFVVCEDCEKLYQQTKDKVLSYN